MDNSEVVDDVAALLDYSIATQGYVTKASDRSNYVDLRQVDVDALRAKFDNGHKATEVQKLRGQIAQKLTRMVRLNRTRIDFLHETLISDAVFQKVQEAIGGKTAPHKQINDDFPLRSLVRCAACGKNRTSGWVKGRNDHYPRYWCWT